MRKSIVAQVAVLLALTAGTGSAAKERFNVKNYGVKFKIAWWDDGRALPYRIRFTKKRITSVYKFDAAGRLRRMTVDGEVFRFEPSVVAGDGAGSRMLLSNLGEMEADEMEFDQHRRLYACSDCEKTWSNLCDIGLPEVCSYSDQDGFFPAGDVQKAVNKMCNKFGKECQTSAEDACEGICVEDDPCAPNPCENGGSCSPDPAGGHVCSCSSGYGGMACQTATSSLASFFIEIEFIGTWTAARRAVFQSAASRWARVVTHVPCGGTSEFPAGRLLIIATLEEIDGQGGVLGSSGPTFVWSKCLATSLKGAMKFDIADIDSMEADGIFEGVILHEMGHVIGVGTLWGDDFGDCTTCYEDGSSAWTCPAALSSYADIGGSDENIVELDGASGTRCANLDEDIFGSELMTGFVDNPMYLSKMTAAILDDLKYVVDPSEVDSYTLPVLLGGSVVGDTTPTKVISDVAVDAIILAIDSNGDVDDEILGINMEF